MRYKPSMLAPSPAQAPQRDGAAQGAWWVWENRLCAVPASQQSRAEPPHACTCTLPRRGGLMAEMPVAPRAATSAFTSYVPS